MFFNRIMRSVFELGAGDLVSRLETKNSVLFSELREGLNKEVKEESFLVYVLVYLGLSLFSINGEFHLYLGF